MVVAAVSEDAEGDFEWGGEGVLASILPVRAELVAGDVRALYLLWLSSVQIGESPGDATEPPVPVLLNALTGSQTALVEVLRIDRDLIDVAAAGALVDLRDVTDPAEFARRLECLRREHGRKVTFVEPLGHAAL